MFCKNGVNCPMVSLAPVLSLLSVVQDAHLALLADPDSDLIQPTSLAVRCTTFLWEAGLQKDLMALPGPAGRQLTSLQWQDGLKGSWKCSLCPTALIAALRFPNNSSSEVQRVHVCLPMLDWL